METDYEKYGAESKHGALVVGGSVVKYASLLTGIYSVCQDEKDFLAAGISLLAYYVGEGLQNMGKELIDVKRFSRMEKMLKEKK